MNHPPSQVPGGNGRPWWRGRGWKVVAVMAAGVVLVAAGVVFGLWKNGGSADTAEDSGPPSASPSVPSVEPPRGEATAAAEQATRTVSGLPRGFPRTEAGAVEAGASYLASVAELYRMTSFERWRYTRDAMTDPPSLSRLDEDAEAAVANGSAADCRPELGAYRTVAFTADRAVVDHWMPCLAGPDASRGGDEARARWLMGRMVLRWERDDWRVGELLQGPFDELITPPEPGDPVVPLAERLALLGEDWELYADATDEPLPPAAPPGLPW
ncbi:hypothetical protein [Streptomyces johnsoniae]|uniref:DUF8175 domain-containing protein n=1 Tax=Streptomyces johnsoniae TaxID=3075532 RepID=A0ABU2SEI5_9ACTN|nr:hypothetical protein [Streptomyces sp. DSM 41886]MDT0446824.1 hypothetical protein [Streptomyces sp. DSM 41886]